MGDPEYLAAFRIVVMPIAREFSRTWSWCQLGLMLPRVTRPHWVATMFLPSVLGT